MKTIPIRRSAWIAVAIAVAFAAAPVLSASSPGSITLTRVGTDDSPFVNGVAPIQWNWKAGDKVRHASQLDLRAVHQGTGQLVLWKYRYVHFGSFDWDTSSLDEGVYTVTATVRNYPSIRSIISPIIVDRTKPAVEITRPAAGGTGIYIEDEEVGSGQVVVFGATTLEAKATDNLSGVASVDWYLDDRQIELTDGRYDFSAEPSGPYALRAVATDSAGNVSEPDTRSIVVIGGAGVPDLGDPEPPGGEDPELPELPGGEDPELPIGPNDPQLPPELQELLDQVPNPDDPQTPDPTEGLPSLEDLTGNPPV